MYILSQNKQYAIAFTLSLLLLVPLFFSFCFLTLTFIVWHWNVDYKMVVIFAIESMDNIHKNTFIHTYVHTEKVSIIVLPAYHLLLCLPSSLHFPNKKKYSSDSTFNSLCCYLLKCVHFILVMEVKTLEK